MRSVRPKMLVKQANVCSFRAFSKKPEDAAELSYEQIIENQEKRIDQAK